MDIRKRQNGITLIALVVTIVVLLILAGVTISAVFSENGIVKKAQEAANRTQEAVANEQDSLNKLYNDLEAALNTVPEPEPEPEPEPDPLPSDGSYSELKGVNTPKLGNGMTAIKWNGSAWVETTGDDEEWYDYSAKKWANAKTSDGSMWVWIPRYAYSITSMYHTTGDTTTAGTIEVEFMKGTSNESATGRTTFQNASGQGNWNIHPAFEYGETVSGIWVAKFEASQSDAEQNDYKYGTPQYSGGTSGVLKIQPGVNSWRGITISEMYDICLNYNSTLNSHMMKNDEWGACAYLSKSRYGKETEEVWINNSYDYITGSAGNSATAGSDVGTDESNYASTQSVKASTTGNVYGIYDMSGGSWEYVAAYINNGNANLTTNYGKSVYEGEAKTKNVYAIGSTDTQQNNYNANSGVYGDVVWETSNGYNTSNGSWYADYSIFPGTGFPFFLRGGYDGSGSSAGVFYFLRYSGYYSSGSSFRPVLVAL